MFLTYICKKVRFKVLLSKKNFKSIFFKFNQFHCRKIEVLKNSFLKNKENTTNIPKLLKLKEKHQPHKTYRTVFWNFTIFDVL